MKRLVGLSAVAIAALSGAGMAAAGGPVAGTAKSAKVGAQLQAQANLSPVQDYVQFNAGLASSSKPCVVRSVQIRRPAGNVLLETVKTASPRKSGSRWSASGFGSFRQIAGLVARGEPLRAEVAQKKVKKGGKVKLVCKAATKSFVVP